MKLIMMSLLLSLSAFASPALGEKGVPTMVKTFECYGDEDEEMENTEDLVENADTGKYEKRKYEADEQTKKLEQIPRQ